MSSNEEYLDSLLAALDGEPNEEAIVEPKIKIEPEEIAEPEEIPVVSLTDDPNKALGADEIAALFAQANMDIETGDAIEESEVIEEQETIEEPESIEEPEEIAEPEEIPVVSLTDDPNKALGADEIAALFAQANMDIETGDTIEESEVIEEQETIEEPESIEEPEEIAEPEDISVVSLTDDPNKALGADEIAALFAQANMDIETGDTIEESEVIEEPEQIEEPEPVEEPTDGEMEEGLSIDDMLARMIDEEIESEEKEPEEIESGDWEVDIQDSPEEIEIDMNNPEELELLLGLGERPDWSARKAEAEKERKEQSEAEQSETEQSEAEQSEDDILAAMSEENPDLNEINSLLKKLDNNELVGDGIEESILVDFDETDFEADQDPWLDELLGSTKGKKRKKKEKKKFSLFGKKKKEEEEVQNDSLETEVPEEVSEEDTEAVTDILQAFSEDNSEIPLELFEAAEEEAEEEIDLIALAEADAIKQSTKNKKSQENKGFFAKMWDALTEEIPEEEAKASEEKKEKKAKKAKKGKKKPVTDAEDNEGILEELDAEDAAGKKGKKAKKAKKVKKAKKEPKPMDEASLMDIVQDSKKLPMKMVIRIFALCCSVMALILLVNHFVPKLWSLADARNAFYKQDYETTYQEMSGKELSESDQRLFEKAKMILQLNHKLDAYGNYKEMHMPVEALDSLLSGYLLWQQLRDKISEYDAVTETEEIKVQIVNTLSTEYQISEQEAEEINSLSNYDYTLKLEEITGSLSRQNSTFYSEQETVEEEMQQTEQQPQEPTENVLSEEEVQ